MEWYRVRSPSLACNPKACHSVIQSLPLIHFVSFAKFWTFGVWLIPLTLLYHRQRLCERLMENQSLQLSRFKMHQKALPVVKNCICVIMPVCWSISAGACGIPLWQLSQSHTSNYRHMPVPLEKWPLLNAFIPDYTFKFCEWITVDRK